MIVIYNGKEYDVLKTDNGRHLIETGEWVTGEVIKSQREKAHELIDAYFDRAEIIVRDPDHGVPHWTNIRSNEIWTFIEAFCENVDKYKIIYD